MTYSPLLGLIIFDWIAVLIILDDGEKVVSSVVFGLIIFICGFGKWHLMSLSRLFRLSGFSRPRGKGAI